MNKKKRFKSKSIFSKLETYVSSCLRNLRSAEISSFLELLKYEMFMAIRNWNAYRLSRKERLKIDLIFFFNLCVLILEVNLKYNAVLITFK